MSLQAFVDGRSGYVAGMGMLALPGQKVQIQLTPDLSAAMSSAGGAGRSATAAINEQYEWKAQRGTLINVQGSQVTFQCPQKSGSCRVSVRYYRGTTIRSASGPEITQACEAEWALHLFVQYPYDRDGNGTIEGYPIGIYPNEDDPMAPATVLTHRDRYRPPQWFARVSRDERDIRISPHFSIGEFCSPYSTDDPTFVSISPRLITRLEATWKALQGPGIPTPRIKILRAYIGPNEKSKLQRQGLEVSQFSRVLYGDSVSVIVDVDGDGKMDDLNADGVVDLKDADYFSRVVEQVARATTIRGGIGVHADATDPLLPNTPFVSFDCRGWAIRY